MSRSPPAAGESRYWPAYTEAHHVLLQRTHSTLSPWRIMPADNQRPAGLHRIRNVLSCLHDEGRHQAVVQLDPDIAFDFTPHCISGERLAL